MQSQWAKDLFHGTVGRLSLLNSMLIQHVCRSKLDSSRPDELRWARLGCGAHYIQGMINLDINPFRKSDIWLDLRRGLPFDDRSVDAIYCCHVFEHFYEWEVRSILRECHRVLKAKCGIRIVTPDLRKSVEAYLRNDDSFFSNFPDERKSIGGKLANHLLCRDQHRLVFDFSFWEEILSSEGFEVEPESAPHRSRIFPSEELARWEYERPGYHTSVFVEALRPSREMR